MPNAPTPGQTCYAAYIATLPYAEPWSDLSAAAQARWEAAAQALLAWHQEVTTGRRCADCGVVRPTPSLGLGRWLCGRCVRALAPQEEDTP